MALKQPLKQVADQPVASVELPGVHAVDVPHQPRQVAPPRVQHPMEVVAHLAVGQHLCAEPLHCLGDDVQLGRPVSVVPIDWLATITSCSEVVDRAGELDSKGTRHVGERAADFGMMQDLTPCSRPSRARASRVAARSTWGLAYSRSNCAKKSIGCADAHGFWGHAQQDAPADPRKKPRGWRSFNARRHKLPART